MNIKNVTSPCIYMAVNKINGKRYIGKSVNFQARYKKHKYAKYYNTYFHNAIRKYEFENFEWSILEENLPINLLIERENYWIDYYNTLEEGYNLRKDSKENSGWTHSEETKKLIGKKGLGRPGWNKGLTGLTHILSEEGKKSFKRKMSGRNNPNAKAVYQYDKDYNFIASYGSVSTAASMNNCDFRGISACALGGRKYYKGYIWSYEPKAAHHSDMMLISPLIAGNSHSEMRQSAAKTLEEE